MTVFPFGKLVRNGMSEQDEPRAVSESLQHPTVLAGLAPAVLPAVTSSEAVKARTCGFGPADRCGDADARSRYSSSILQTPPNTRICSGRCGSCQPGPGWARVAPLARGELHQRDPVYPGWLGHVLSEPALPAARMGSHMSNFFI